MFLVFLVMFSYLTSGFPIDRCQVMPGRCLTIPDEPCPAKPQRKTRPVTIWNKQANIFCHGILSWCISITAATMIQMFMFPLFSYESLHIWFFLQSVNPSGCTVPWWSQCVNVPSPWFRSWIKNCPLHMSCLSSASSDDWLASSMISWQSW